MSDNDKAHVNPPSQQQLEERLKTSEATLRAIYDNAQEGILVASVETGLLTMANPAICRMLGYTEDELSAMRPMDLHPPETQPKVREIFEKMQAGDFSLVESLPFRRKDGTHIYCDVSPTLIPINGKPAFLGVFRDVTRQREDRERIQMLQRLVDFSSQGIGWADLDTTVRYFNPALRRMLAVPEDVLSQHIPVDLHRDGPHVRLEGYALSHRRLQALRRLDGDGRAHELVVDRPQLYPRLEGGIFPLRRHNSITTGEVR